MSIYSIERFHQEVISKGSESTMPENLPDEWLDILSQIHFDENEEDNQSELDELLIYAVLHILAAKQAPSSAEKISFTAEEMFEFVEHYKIEIAVEVVNRIAGRNLTRPTLATIFTNRVI